MNSYFKIKNKVDYGFYSKVCMPHDCWELPPQDGIWDITMRQVWEQVSLTVADQIDNIGAE